MLNTVHSHPGHILNFVVLATKVKIYVFRCMKKDINASICLAYINECQRIEKYIAIKNGKMSQHIHKWQGTIVNPKRPHDKNNIFNCEEYAQQYITQTKTFNM